MPDHLQFTQDVTRHRLPIEAHRFSGRNTYDLTSFAISMVMGKLPEYRISLAGCGRLFSRVDLDGLSHNTAKLHLDEIYDLVVLVPQHEDLDESFPTRVISWAEVRHFGKDKRINFIPIANG